MSRPEWTVRWLRLPRSGISRQDNGLILIQIDGLSRDELEVAIADDRMPYLKQLIRKEHYVLHSFYAGLPSSTPAVQGELFYGVRTAVPAFGFVDHETGQPVRMFSPETAAKVQARIDTDRAGLLTGGSSYCNIYDGGAEESHFCAASIGWGQVWRASNPFKLAVVAIGYGASLIRALAMMLIELVLAIIDFLKRATTGRELGQELLMIASRVVIAIGLRELTIISASIDATRGLPIIHVNLIGYDEHAHRRGPRSAFARWTLKGLDRCIQRLASAANLSDQRDYDIWVYSDHGQETTTAYPYISGQTILQACKKVALEPNSQQKNAETNWQRPSRAQWLSAGRWAGRLFGDGSSDTDDGKPLLQVSSCGPVGHVYSVRLLTDLQKMNAARALVNDHNVPMVLVAGKDPSVVAITDEGDYQLPECSRQLFGDDHPFVDEVGHDLVRLCHHADAGQLVLSGWRRKRSQVTFSLQAGAHGGPGAIETHGFALLPRDAPLSGGGRYLRPNDLRESALAYRRGGRPTTSRCAVGPLPQPRACDRIRVATYNVHGCLGLDGQFLPQRIARVVSQCEADVVALQELDVGRSRSGRVDQARAIAQTLNMQHHFFGAWRVEEECYGDAILSRLPFRLIRSGELPTTKANRERRGAIWIELGFDNTKLQIINTHLSLYPIERKIQAEALVGDVWAGAARQQGPTILLGDFNARPRSAAWKIIDATMRDAHLQAPGPTPATWFSTRPLFRIDHVFGTKELRVESASVLDNQLSRIASDHLPLVVQFQLNTSSNCARTSASDPLDCRLRSLPEGHQ